MKKWIGCMAAVMVLLLCMGCRKTNKPADSNTLSVPSGAVMESFPLLSSAEEESAVSEERISVPEVKQPSEGSSHETKGSEEVSWPVGVSRYSKGKLCFTTSVLSLSVIFPEAFCVLNTDYYPSYGIYLQNKDGTATLLVESVVDKTLTYRQMAAYLREKYPSATVYTNDSKDVICKLTMNDQDGHALYIQQKIRVKSGGYNAAVLCCPLEEKSRYEKVFNDISFK